MTFILLAAAAATLPPPLTPDEQAGLRCAAVLALVAEDQRSGRGFGDAPPTAAIGQTYMGIVGDAAAAVPGRDEQVVAGWLRGLAAAARREGVPRPVLDRCLSRAAQTIAADQAAAR